MKKIICSTFLLLCMSMGLLTSGCTSAATPSSVPANTLEADMPFPTDIPYTIAEVEKLAGFDVKEPAYLPTGVSFDFASYQKTPSPAVSLYFKIVHATYGDMGTFFQIVQEPQAQTDSNTAACDMTVDGCEIIQIGTIAVEYRLSTPTESLAWSADGFSFRLLRTAGEPNKIYKDELLKVAGSMK